MFTLNCKGRLLTFHVPAVMGIINITPDSFYSGSRKQSTYAALELAEKMMREGASMLDIGGQSTRPNSKKINAAEEAERVLPVIELIHKTNPETIISIDTYYASVAVQAVNAGASVVNDISGGLFDNDMLGTVAALKIPYICMHMKGTPQDMQEHAVYENVVKVVLDHFIERTEACRAVGINDVMIDPGFGFAKTIAHNFELLRHLAIFKILEKPILAGISRKSTVYKTLGITAEEALNGSTVLHTIALLNGADILRTHDVKEAAEAIKLVETYRQV